MYRAWAASLRAPDYSVALNKSQLKGAWDWYKMRSVDTQAEQILRGRTVAAYRAEAAIAREVFAAFIPAFDGKDEPRVAWLSDKAKCAAGAAAVERMLEEEQKAVDAVRKAVATVGGTEKTQAPSKP